uniref:Esa1-associated factor 6 homolog n=1 Tax=Caenorhabditis tropicalis TaxID=1561998 RepID=A0A1I7U1R4_9PELO
MIKEKSKFQTVSRSYAMTKAGLSKEKELAQQRGDLEEAKRIQNHIDEIEQYADELDRERSKSIQAIAFINYRNRNQNKDKILGGKLKIAENFQDDPFTRKRGGMRIVSGSKSKVSASSSITNVTKAEIKTPLSITKPVQPSPIISKDQKIKRTCPAFTILIWTSTSIN